MPAPKSVAFVSTRMPYAAPSGSQRYMHSLVDFMQSRGHRVDIILNEPDVPFVISRLKQYFPSGRMQIWAPGIFRIGRWHLVFKLSRVAKNIVTRLLTLLPARLTAVVRGLIFAKLKPSPTETELGHPQFVDPAQEAISEFQKAYVTGVLDRLDPDLVFFDGVLCAVYCEQLQTSAIRSVITHDVLHQRHETIVARGFEIIPRQITRDDEIDLLNQFDLIVAIHDQEKTTFEDMVPDRDIITVPYTTQSWPRNDEREVPGRCIFAGSLEHHNVDGLRWFLSDVWPLVVSRLPDAQFHVFGSVCEVVSESGPGIVFRGEVPDLKEEYAQASLGIICLKSGSGLKIKIVEALSHGLPCITTSIGAQGLDRTDTPPFVLADEDGEFADGVVNLLSDVAAREHLKSGLPGFRAQFAPERVYADLIARGL